MSEDVIDKHTQDPTIIENKLYYLVSGEVIAKQKDLPEQVYTSRHNIIISGTGEQITPKELAMIQWSLEQNYLSSLSEEMKDKVEVYQAVIISIIPLGYFTKEEWDSYYQA